MSEYLKDHAIKNVWCSPAQDNQIIVQAQRITRPGGEYVSCQVMTARINLPKKDRRYHLYQIGQAHPSIMGLLPRNPSWALAEWKTFSEAVENLPLFSELYTDDGDRISLHRSYYMYTNQRALIFAVDVTEKTWTDYDVDKIYLRLYTNAFYASVEANDYVDNTRCEGGTIYQTSDILKYQSRVTYYRSKGVGAVLCFVNGVHVEAIDLITTHINDDVEIVYDASVKRIIDLKVDSLNVFRSTLDREQKYLLHYPKTGDNVIDFVDDVDVYILAKTGDRFNGRIYHKNLASALRMVTHRDYSLSVSNYRHIAENFASEVLGETTDLRSFHIRLYIRNSGFTRPLVFDHHRIFELYKLKDSEVVSAMVGVNSEMTEWYAPKLEDSAYTKLMRVGYTEITEQLVEDAYGYNAMSKLIGDGPIKVDLLAASPCATLPVGAYFNSTIYEYDANGYLLEYHQHKTGKYYYPNNPLTTMIEPIVGLGDENMSTYLGTDNIPIPDDSNYRVYMCYITDGIVDNKWKEVTNTEHYKVVDGKLVWQNLERGQWLMVRTDEKFLTYDLELEAVEGTFAFDISEWIDGVKHAVRVPMGDLDIWLNGRSLIRDLDYRVELPNVYLFNKQYLKQPSLTTKQKITIRFTGFAEPGLKLKDTDDYGFIEHEVMSNNNQFDLRDDRVIRITLDGALKSRADIKFSEDTLGVKVVSALNGAPYQIKNVVVPLAGYTEEETYALREKSLAVDQRVSDYLTPRIPQPERPAVSSIPDRHTLVSPFFARLVDLVKNNHIDRALLEKELSAMDVINICNDYEYMLKNDPLNEELKINHAYVAIHPTALNYPVSLSIYAYRFIKMAADLYSRGHINVSTHLTINLGE